MKLYMNPISTYSQKVLIAFKEKEVEYEPHIVNLFDPQESEKYKELYPFKKIPLLITEDDFIPESTIIIEYLENNFPDKGIQLIPAAPVPARKARFKDRMIDLYLTNPSGGLFFQSIKPENERDQQTITNCKNTINTFYKLMEESLSTSSHASGNQFSIADCSLVPSLCLANKVHSYEGYNHIEQYMERIVQRASVKQVLADGKEAYKAAGYN